MSRRLRGPCQAALVPTRGTLSSSSTCATFSTCTLACARGGWGSSCATRSACAAAPPVGTGATTRAPGSRTRYRARAAGRTRTRSRSHCARRSVIIPPPGSPAPPTAACLGWLASRSLAGRGAETAVSGEHQPCPRAPGVTSEGRQRAGAPRCEEPRDLRLGELLARPRVHELVAHVVEVQKHQRRAAQVQ
jgi:hypothetical protein